MVWLPLLLILSSLFYHLEPANSILPQVFVYVPSSAWGASPSCPTHPSGLSINGNISEKVSCPHTKKIAFIATNSVSVPISPAGLLTP